MVQQTFSNHLYRIALLARQSIRRPSSARDDVGNMSLLGMRDEDMTGSRWVSIPRESIGWTERIENLLLSILFCLVVFSFVGFMLVSCLPLTWRSDHSRKKMECKPGKKEENDWDPNGIWVPDSESVSLALFPSRLYFLRFNRRENHSVSGDESFLLLSCQPTLV